MRKNKIIIAALAVAALIGLSSCKSNKKEQVSAETSTSHIQSHTTHNYNVESTAEKYLKSEATHNLPAEYYYSCECGEKGTKSFLVGNPLDHTFDKQVSTDKYLKSEATCMSPALYYYSCECGQKGIETFEVGALAEHKYNVRNVTLIYLASEATCTSPKKFYFSCECGEKGTEIFEIGNPLNHTFDKQVSTEQYLKSAATCTSPAEYYYSCECGEKGTEAFEVGEPLNHTFDKQVSTEQYLKSTATCTSPALYYYSCECGEKDTEAFEVGTLAEHKIFSGACRVCGYLDLVNNLYAIYNGTLYFGYYPQSEVTDEDLLNELIALMPQTKPSNDDSQGFYGYPIMGLESDDDPHYIMWYKDIDLNSDGLRDYRCVYIEEYINHLAFKPGSSVQSVQYFNGYYTGNYYFFKFEPIGWHMYKDYYGANNSGGAYTIYAEIALDCQQFNYTTAPTRTMDGTEYYSSNYKYSSIREWLNDYFYYDAFTVEQRDNMLTDKVDNQNGLPGKLIGENTYDYVWIFSHEDIRELTGDAGYNITYKVTDYARCQSSSADNVAYVLLRTPSEEKWVMYYTNDPYNLTDVMTDVYLDIVPVITIKKIYGSY